MGSMLFPSRPWKPRTRGKSITMPRRSTAGTPRKSPEQQPQFTTAPPDWRPSPALTAAVARLLLSIVAETDERGDRQAPAEREGVAT
jgi:hypothetical protein